MGNGILSEMVRQELETYTEELYGFRRDLHRYPEPSGKEEITSAKIKEKLESYGYDVRIIGGTGLYTELKGIKEGPVIILRADIDALPIEEKSSYPYPSEHKGFMHACGHDVHTTALLGAARFLSAHRDSLAGTVRFVFQNAEEQGHGSKYFLAERVTDGAERVYGFHVSPHVRLGNILITEGADLASCDSMKIRLYGKSSHIARPHLGNDVSVCAADIVIHLRALAGGLDPLTPALIGIGRISSGTGWNIISDYGEIEGTVRTFSVEQREMLIRSVEEVINRVSTLYGVRAETEFELNAGCLINDAGAYATAYQASADTVGEAGVTVKHTPFGFTADDFSEFSKEVPGCFIHVGTAIDDREDTKVSLHSPDLYITDEAVTIGSELLIRCALEHLETK
ncbi:MAG: amidohydrolase [Lachnospiraceae bacterium]|nr:amidohydrolase [Lachnospiraceae bacterium]